MVFTQKPTQEIKLAALTDLLSEITGRDIFARAGYGDRDAEAEALFR